MAVFVGYVWIDAWMCVCLSVCVATVTCMCVCLYVCVSVCVCVHMYPTTTSYKLTLCISPCRKQQKQESSLSTTVRALDSLLSLATVISDALRTTMAATKSATQRLSRKESHGDMSQRIDSKSASTLCTIAIHLVKQNLFKKEDEAEVPVLKGCGRFGTQRALYTCAHTYLM